MAPSNVPSPRLSPLPRSVTRMKRVRFQEPDPPWNRPFLNRRMRRARIARPPTRSVPSPQQPFSLEPSSESDASADDDDTFMSPSSHSPKLFHGIPMRRMVERAVETDSESDSDSCSSDIRRRASLSIMDASPILIESDSDDDHISSARERRAQSRNDDRVKSRDTDDKSTLCKLPPFERLPKEPTLYTGGPVEGPDDVFIPPPDFLQSLKQVHHTEVPAPKPPPVMFRTDDEALAHNAQMLADAGFDVGELIRQHSDTTLGYGSEFRPVEQLKLIFKDHPLLPKLIAIIEHGMDYSFTRDLSEEERLAEVYEILRRGNHKSAEHNSSHVESLLATDVSRGFSLPLPKRIVDQIPNAMVQPLGMVTQSTIDELGGRIPKLRLTHDLSFSATAPDASVNKRIDFEQYTELIYGFCLPRLLHWIVSLRRDYPGVRILLAKFDYSDAYRRMALAAIAAHQSIAIFNDIAYLALRLTFGGAPNPAAFCTLSEMVADLANEIVCDPNFNSTDFPLPDVEPVVSPNKNTIPDDRPFAQAESMAVHIPTSITARVDAFIDDLIAAMLDLPGNRYAHLAVPTAIHCTSRPLSEKEPLPRKPNLSQTKLEAEGTPQEQQHVLGWYLGTRSLAVSLPMDKYRAWDRDLDMMLSARKTTFAELESTVGRLNHAAYVIPLARHFIKPLRDLLYPRRNPSKVIHLHSPERRCLRLWRKLLQRSHEGISMNRLVTRQPTHLMWSDSCPFGIGGFLLTSGRAWRIRIPKTSPIYGLQIANNWLEFLGMVINIWLQVQELQGSSKSACILALGDNTSAIGWLKKTSHIDKSSPYFHTVNMIANKLASLIIDSEHCLASQHFPGRLNWVSDCLSFEGTSRGKPHPLASDCPPDDVLTQRFLQYTPQLIPEGFVISPLPDEILSWITAVLRTAESSMTPSRNPATNEQTAIGNDTYCSAPKQASTTTPSSLTYPQQSESWSPDPSWRFIADADLPTQSQILENVQDKWQHALSKMPQGMWLRRFGTISGSRPFTSLEAQDCSQL
jgi:hypothetical protein